MKKTLYLIGLVALFNCKKEEKPQKIEQKSFVISNTMMKTTTLADVEKQFVEDEIHFYGKIANDKNQYIDIYPLVGGNVLNVNVELGDYVYKGQTLATIRSTEVAGFQRDLSDAKTELAVAKNNLRVSNELFEGKLNTDKDVLEAKSMLRKAQDELKRAESVSQVYNVREGNIYTVTAPISGYIVQKSINKDMQLRSDRSENIFDVANTTNVWAIVNVNESDINKINIGMEAEVTTIANPGVVFMGKIDKIFKIINPETNSMQAKVILDNANGQLIPESKATIKIKNTETTTALSIPSKALIFDDNRYYVIVFKSQSDVKIQEVRLLKQTNDRSYISEGLHEDEKVVTNNGLLIYRALSE